MAALSQKAWLIPLLAGALGGIPGAFAQEGGRLAPVYDRSGMVQSSEAAAATSSLDSRVSRLERLMENQALVDMLMRLDGLQADTQDLRGNFEELVHELDDLKQRQRNLYLDIDRRLRQVELALTKVQAAPATATTPPAAVPVPASAGTNMPTAAAEAATPLAVSAEPADPAAERAAYQAAFNELKQGRYEQAIEAFETFLQRYPKGEYAGNAQYWLGEANYVTRQFKVAEREFKAVLERFPDSSKVADAMLKLGYTYYELAQWDDARKVLSEAAAKNPNSTVARLAENRLQKMRMEGR